MRVKEKICIACIAFFNKRCLRNTKRCATGIHITFGKEHHSFSFAYESNEIECPYEDAGSFITILQSCTRLKDVRNGLRLHGQIVEAGFLESDRFIGSVLLDMYAKCGLFTKALQVFNKLLARDVVLWTSLISGYAEHGLKACSSLGAVLDGSKIHAEIERQSLLCSSPFLGSSLIDMYVKSGFLIKAQEVFDRLNVRNEVLWNSLIVGYGAHGHGEVGFQCFKRMQLEGFFPNSVTFIGALKTCSNMAVPSKGHEVHAMLEIQGLVQKDLLVGSTLIDTYSKCGLLPQARQVFDMLPEKNVVAWTALLGGYAADRNGMEVFHFFEQMESSGISPSTVTYVYLLKACSSLGSTDKGRAVHIEVERKGLLKVDPNVGNALVDMYAKCNVLAIAHEVFDNLSRRTVVSWTALITGYAEHGHNELALQLYDEMQCEGITPNVVTLICVLQACKSIRAAQKGKEIHTEIKKQGLEADNVVGNSLIDMYAKCGMLDLAKQVFDNLQERTVVSWTVLISGYAEYGQNEVALKLYRQMQLEEISPDCITYNWILKACTSLRDVENGEEVHTEIERHGLLERDHSIGNALVEMYSNCGLLITARQIFDKLPVKNQVGLAALISCYTEQGLGEEALKCFEKVQSEGVSLNVTLYTLILRACSSIGALDKGNEFHAEIQRQGLLEKDLLVGNTLIDMYAKCGALTKAHQVFDKLERRDVVSWTALIMGYTQHGEKENVLCLFNKMLEENVKPDPVIFLVVLSACSRMGLYKQSETFMEAMQTEYGVIPTLKHHTCAVDLLGRAGQLDKAIEIMGNSPDLVVWRVILSACRNWGNLELGKQAFEDVNCMSEELSLCTSLSHMHPSSHKQS
ncbi:hypothetical protein KP509_13G010800 [Ceratopteris richardii]|uniref:Pentatricopeptide repeat-containing protein n=1 Tax=Ceratopteris richardii TaxID=49495 RepID=A0A8T2TGN6_CERRI|nr:hypothetical protein KP509_13G010800 [Ceratopteris richardii]